MDDIRGVFTLLIFTAHVTHTYITVNAAAAAADKVTHTPDTMEIMWQQQHHHHWVVCKVFEDVTGSCIEIQISQLAALKKCS